MPTSTFARRAAMAFFALAAGVLFVSCSVNQGLLLKKDGSASATLRLESSGPFLEYVLAVADVVGMKDLARQGKIYDLKEIQKGLEARPGITVKKIGSPSPEILELELSFQSIAEAFAKDEALKGAGILSISDAGGKKTMRVRLDRGNFRQIASLFPILGSPMFSGMGPQAGGDVSEEDYLAMLEYAMGAGGPAAVQKAAIEISVKAEGEILSQTGGSISGGAAVFRIPLIRILLLDKPVELTVTYR